MSNLYTKSNIAEYKKAEKALAKEQQKLEQRIQEVLNVISIFYNDSVKNWYFPNAMEGEVGTCQDLDGDDEREISLTMNSLFELSFDGWNYNEGFPKKFLFMTDEEIFDFLNAEKELQDNKAKILKEKRLEDKKFNERLKKEALALLSKEQRKVLGFK
jgi:hypothetical protein